VNNGLFGQPSMVEDLVIVFTSLLATWIFNCFIITTLKWLATQAKHRQPAHRSAA
jgi:hypothetical protein